LNPLLSQSGFVLYNYFHKFCNVKAKTLLSNSVANRFHISFKYYLLHSIRGHQGSSRVIRGH